MDAYQNKHAAGHIQKIEDGSRSLLITLDMLLSRANSESRLLLKVRSMLEIDREKTNIN